MVFVLKVEFHGLDGHGGPLYIGTGCFHRRDVLCGKKFSKGYRNDWNNETYKNFEGGVNELEEKSKHLASCAYEENTQWGKEVSVSVSPSIIYTSSSLTFLKPDHLTFKTADGFEVWMSCRRCYNGVVDTKSGMEIGLLQPKEGSFPRCCTNNINSDTSST